MNRRLLDALYVTDSAGALKRAASLQPLSAECYQFLCERAGALSVEQAVALLKSKLADGVEAKPKTILQRLAELIAAYARTKPQIWFPQTREVLECADSLPSEAWLDELVWPLMPALQPRQWYAYVEKVRGGVLFPKVVEELLRCPDHGNWNGDELSFIKPDNRSPDATILRALELAHNDLGLAELASEVLQIRALLRLHRQYPERIDENLLRRAAIAHTERSSDCFATADDVELLPDWIIPVIAKRLRHCGDEEARVLYDWLFSDGRNSDSAVAFEIAVHRFKGAVLSMSPGDGRWRYWCPLIGKHLGTGSSWKTGGRDLLDFCIRAGKGFPSPVLDAAFDAAQPSDGASAEEHRSAILRRIHDETARLLMEFAASAAERGKFAEAARYLRALRSLDAGSFITGSLHRFGKKPGLPEDLRGEIHACATLARLGNRTPTKDAFIDAFHVLLGLAS